MRYECLVLATNIDHHNEGLGSSFPVKPYDYSKNDPSYFDALGHPSDVSRLDRFLRDWKMSRVLAKLQPGWKSQLAEILSKRQSLIAPLRGNDILTANLTALKTDVVKLFEEITGVVRPTAAAKIIHVQAPDLCPLWDLQIRGGYGCASNAEGYHNFLRRTKEELEQVVKTYADSSPGLTDPLNDFMARIASPFPGISATRILDHYNYQKYTRRSLPPSC